MARSTKKSTRAKAKTRGKRAVKDLTASAGRQAKGGNPNLQIVDTLSSVARTYADTARSVVRNLRG